MKNRKTSGGNGSIGWVFQSATVPVTNVTIRPKVKHASKEGSMIYRNFEHYLSFVHAQTHPELLDDDLPDAFGEWMDTLSVDEWIEFADKYASHAVAERERAIAAKLRVWINTPSPTENIISYIYRGIDYVTKTKQKVFAGPSAPSTLTPQEMGGNEKV